MKETCEAGNKPKTFKEMMRSSYFWKPAAAVIIGGIAGFLYYFYVGCASGSCGITSNPFSSVLMGSAMGYFIVNSPCKTC
jgi:hypothetical protein